MAINKTVHSSFAPENLCSLFKRNCKKELWFVSEDSWSRNFDLKSQLWFTYAFCTDFQRTFVITYFNGKFKYEINKLTKYF